MQLWAFKETLSNFIFRTKKHNHLATLSNSEKRTSKSHHRCWRTPRTVRVWPPFISFGNLASTQTRFRILCHVVLVRVNRAKDNLLRINPFQSSFKPVRTEAAHTRRSFTSSVSVRVRVCVYVRVSVCECVYTRVRQIETRLTSFFFPVFDREFHFTDREGYLPLITIKS